MRILLGLSLLLASCSFAPTPEERRPSALPGAAAVTCAGDPACRLLTPGEIRLAMPIFGDRIDYAAVRILDRRDSLLRHLANITAMGNDIRIHDPSKYAPDFAAAAPALRALFLHEMTHVWQYQAGRNFFWETLGDLLRHGFDRRSVYDYALGGRPFSDYSPEQQAQIVATYHTTLAEVSAATDAGRRRSLCGSVRAHEAVLATALPVQRAPLCAEP
jgi:hypothetical protein